MRYLCSNTRWYRISSCALQSLSGYFVSMSQYVLSHLTLFGELLCLKRHISFTPFPDLASLVTFVQYMYSFMGIMATLIATLTIPYNEYKPSHTHSTKLAVWESFPHISFLLPAPSVGEPAIPTATATIHIALELVTELRPMGCSCIVQDIGEELIANILPMEQTLSLLCFQGSLTK